MSAAGNPVAVVSDTSDGVPRSRVLEWSAGSWALVGTSLAQASQASLAVSPEGSTYIAYTANDAAQRLRVAQLVGGQWQAASVAGLPDAAATALTLQAAGSGVLYLACNVLNEATGEPTSTVFKLSGATWQALPALDFDAGTPMRLGASGAPLVLGLDAAGDSCLMLLSGGAWQPQGSCIFSFAASPAAIAVTPAGALLVAYTDLLQGDSFAFRLTGSSWQPVGSSLSTGANNAVCQLVAPSETVLVAGCAANGGEASIELYNSTAAAPQWTLLSTAGLPAQLSQLRLAVTSGGGLFAAFSDASNGGVASVRQYAQQ